MALVSTFALSPDLAVSSAPPRLRAGVAGAGAAAPERSSTNWASWSSCLAAGAVVGAAAAGRAKALRRHARRAGAKSSDEVSRSDLFRGLGGFGAAVATTPLAPAPAAAKSLEEAGAQLATYGVPEIAPKVGPDLGWKIVVEPIGLVNDAEYGRFKLGAEPQVVTFNVPPLWIVSTPNIDFNGAAGTVQANDYGKGDSATLYVDTNFKGSVDDLSKKEALAEMKKALTMKGKGFIEGLRITKVRDGAPGYKIIEYDYEIQSAAGFTINRIGIAALTQKGDLGHLQVFWTGIVTNRWSDMEQSCRKIVDSFRIASVPKNVKIPTKNITRDDEMEAYQMGR